MNIQQDLFLFLFENILKIYMHSEKLLIFPNQLFEKKYLPKKVRSIIILEDPAYFGFREQKLNFNKLKLVLHRATMKYYEKYLLNAGYSVEYVEFKELKDNRYVPLSSQLELTMFEINDHLVSSRVNHVLRNKKIKVISNPNFVVTYDKLQEYYKSTNAKMNHSGFYEYIKGEINVLKGEKTYDTENRNKIPSGTNIPELPKIKHDVFIEEAKRYVDSHFPKNYGNASEFIYPITHDDSKKWFSNFLQKRFQHFGEFQDAIVQNQPFLFHSVISPMMNCGLLCPDYIVSETTKYFKKHKNNIEMRNYEGFIRQVIGWREYQRYCYLFAYDKMTKTNIFKHKRRLTSKWYTGNTGVLPVDNAIKEAFKYGYLHHIQRLMVMSNFMNLCQIHPDDCYKWFMEFAVDSYDWVMIQNVYSMGQWADGGLTMRKPYISSDNYIVNMSDYKRNGWSEEWKSLYYHFLTQHRDIVVKTPYGRNLVHWDKMDSEKQKQHTKRAMAVIRKLTA